MLLKAFIYETANPSTEFLKDIFDLIQQNVLTNEFNITKIVDFVSHISLEFKIDNALKGELFYNIESKNLEISIKKTPIVSLKREITIDQKESVHRNTRILRIIEEIKKFVKNVSNFDEFKNFFEKEFNAKTQNGKIVFTYSGEKVVVDFDMKKFSIPSVAPIDFDPKLDPEQLAGVIISEIDFEKEEFIFETVNSNFEIIDISGSANDIFEVELNNGEIIDSNDLYSQLQDIFESSKVRILSNEEPYEVAVTENGDVLGGTVIGIEMPSDEDYDSGVRSIIKFSVATNENYRGLGVASKLINSLIKSKQRHGQKIRAQVINPIMEQILIKFGFEKISESGSSEGLVYEL
jgi:GNAT superfamily N-acetyltransferase